MATVQITNENVVYTVTADPSLNGRLAPVTGKVNATAKKGSQLKSVGYTAKQSDGSVWVKGTDGNFYSKKYLTVSSPEPEPTTTATFRVLGQNLWADYGAKTYTARLSKLNSVRDTTRASLVLGCESGNYADGAALSRAYGWGGKRATTVPNNDASYVLHSNNDVRISHSIHWDSSKYRLLDEGWFNTVKTSTHNGATWSLLEHRSSGVVFYVAVTHCVPWPIGPNNVRKWDLQREQEVGLMLKQLNVMRVKTAKDRKLDVVPAIIGQDFNGSRNDPYDGPGKAMAKYGFIDAYVPAKRRLPAGSVGNRALIDRLGVTKDGVIVHEHTVVPTKGSTDHDYAVAASLELTNTFA